MTKRRQPITLENWEVEYRGRFGLCDGKGGMNCDCKRELAFIRELIELAKASTIPELLNKKSPAKKPTKKK